jgi:hypothetical protein
LRLNRTFGIDDPQPPRAHRGIFSQPRERIGDVAAMQNALDQLLDDRVSFGPVDGDGYSAHAKFLGSICQSDSKCACPTRRAGSHPRRALQTPLTIETEA